MVDDLAELDERIGYCSAEIEVIRDETAAYLKTNFQVRHLAPLINYASKVQVRVLKPVPITLRIKVGRNVNELRAVLDSLACILAVRNGEDPKNVYFPISKDRQTFINDGMRKIKKLAPPDQQTIARLEPWSEANPRLVAFHQLDITRKHQRLPLHAASHAGTGWGPMPGRIGYVTSAETHPCDDLAFDWQTVMTLAAGSFGIQVSPDAFVTFAEPQALRGLEISSGLSWFRDQVGSIVDRFRPSSP